MYVCTQFTQFILTPKYTHKIVTVKREGQRKRKREGGIEGGWKERARERSAGPCQRLVFPSSEATAFTFGDEESGGEEGESGTFLLAYISCFSSACPH